MFLRHFSQQRLNIDQNMKEKENGMVSLRELKRSSLVTKILSIYSVKIPKFTII